jgi:hypothetical protein
VKKTISQAGKTPPIDKDLASQARNGHGIPSQDPDPAAQFARTNADAKHEVQSVLMGGGVVAGAATGAVVGAVAAGPLGVVVGSALGAVAGALGSAAVASGTKP